MNLPSEQSRTFRGLAQGIRETICAGAGGTSMFITASFQAADIPWDSANINHVPATPEVLGLGLRILR